MNSTQDERFIGIDSAYSELIERQADLKNPFEYQEKIDVPSPSSEYIRSDISSKTVHSEVVQNSNPDQDSKSCSECIIQDDASSKSPSMAEKVENIEFATDFPVDDEIQSEGSKPAEEMKISDEILQAEKEVFTPAMPAEDDQVEDMPLQYKILSNNFFWITLMQALFFMMLLSCSDIRQAIGAKFSNMMSPQTRALEQYEEEVCPADIDDTQMIDFNALYKELQEYKEVVNEMHLNLNYTLEILEILSSTGSKIQIRELKSLMSQWEQTIRAFSKSKNMYNIKISPSVPM